MSHAATTWAIQQRGLAPAAKIVLWHLCDRYNPDYGCFPDQDTLAEDCEMSRSSLNNQLAKLEGAGLLLRERRVDRSTRRQMSTRYRFPFERDFPGENPCPEFGHGGEECAESRVQKSADPVSKLLHTEPVMEPVRVTPQSPPCQPEPVAAGGEGFEPTASAEPVADVDPKQDDANGGDGGKAGDGAPDGETGATDRSAAARKAAETRMLDKLIGDWPQAVGESRRRIVKAWSALSAQDKRDAAERATAYRVKAGAPRRNPGRLAAYLGERRFVQVRPLQARPGDGQRERAKLRWEVVEQFLAHADARAVLEQAARDDLVFSLADHVSVAHAVPSLAQYAAARDGWRELRRTWLERCGEPPGSPMHRMAVVQGDMRARWRAFAAEKTGIGGDGKGGGDDGRSGQAGAGGGGIAARAGAG